MTMIVMTPEDWAYGEWSNISLGDARLRRRAVSIGADMLRNLFESPPKMFKAHARRRLFIVLSILRRFRTRKLSGITQNGAGGI